MGLYKREKTWHFSYVINYPDGKKERVRQSLNTSNKGIAEKNYRGFLNSIEDGSFFKKPVGIPQMKEVIERYMKEVSPLQKSHDRNKEIYLHWINYFGDLLASEVTTSLLSSYKAKRLTGDLRFGKNKDHDKRRKAGQSTIKKELAFLRMIFNKAIDEWDDDWDGYFKANPVNPVRKVIKGLKENKRVRYVMPDEAQKLKLTIPAWLRPIVMVGCHTGLRGGNIIELTVSQIDFDRGLITIRCEDMKDGDPLTVKMTSSVRNALLSVIKSRKVKSPYVFINENGKPYSRHAVSMAFKRACDRADVKDLHFHDLRHDFATLLIANNVDLYRVQHLLGHSDSRMTQRYAHLLPGTFNAIDAIEGKGFVTILSQEGEKERGHIT